MELKETEKEENYVRRLATGLCTVWNNNPTAFKWWSGLGLVGNFSVLPSEHISEENNKINNP
jgi:hypothetical protein